MSYPILPWDEPTAIVQPYRKLRRVRQIDDVHCGPATIQMLLSNVGIEVTQQQIAHTIHAENYIEEMGTRIDQLAQAVRILAPDTTLWVKQHTLIQDLEALILQYGFPVGVEWQNLFYETIQQELDDTGWHPENFDFGHYSIVSHIDTEADEIVMVDPYHEFNEEYRYFSLKWFESRWWDFNTVKDGYGNIENRKDVRLSFIITLKGMPFPKFLGMRPL